MDYLFFWGADRKALGDKAMLSQWYPLPFYHDGLMYPTAEHWMMAEKARLFKDGPTLRLIMNTRQPGQAKRLGRSVQGFDEKVWDEWKYDIVVHGNLLKFSQNSEAETYLLSTGDRPFVEASPYDTVWGIGWSENDPEAQNPAEWRGENLLGDALVEVRHILNK